MRTIQKVHQDLDALLAQDLDAQQLRASFEALRQEAGGLLSLASYRFAKRLLETGDVALKVFVRGCISGYAVGPKGRVVKGWGKHKADAAWILGHAEEHDEDLLFQTLFYVVHGKESGERARKRVQVLLERGVRGAALGRELERLSTILRFDDALAVALYNHAPTLARPAILRGLPFRPWNDKGKEPLLPALLARIINDETFYFDIYRRTAGAARWRADVREQLQLASDTQLSEELEKRHLFVLPGDAGALQAEMLEARGRAVEPYLRKHLFVRQLWGKGSFKRLKSAAKATGSDALYAQVVRQCASREEFNAEVQRLLEDGHNGRALLFQLSGTGLEYNAPGVGYARIQALTDDVAVAMFQQAPDLLKGPFRRSLFAGAFEGYPRLVEAVIAVGDTELVDFLASRFVTRTHGFRDAKPKKTAARLSEEYEALLQPADGSNESAVAERRFAERAASVLGQVPAYAIWDYETLLRNNRLARLLYEFAPASYLQSPGAIQDLLEASEIHAQQVGFRALSLDLPEARHQAKAHLRLLGATLLRPLHRRTRALAFAAIRRASEDPACARVLAAQAREALHLPESTYPMEELVGLIGWILKRHPSLRLDAEQPVIYGPPGLEPGPDAMQDGAVEVQR